MKKVSHMLLGDDDGVSRSTESGGASAILSPLNGGYNGVFNRRKFRSQTSDNMDR